MSPTLAKSKPSEVSSQLPSHSLNSEPFPFPHSHSIIKLVENAASSLSRSINTMPHFAELGFEFGKRIKDA